MYNDKSKKEGVLMVPTSLCFPLLINSIWNKEEVHKEQKELIIVPIYTKSDNTGISLLSTMYKILSNILPPRLNPYAE